MSSFRGKTINYPTKLQEIGLKSEPSTTGRFLLEIWHEPTCYVHRRSGQGSCSEIFDPGAKSGPKSNVNFCRISNVTITIALKLA